MADHADGPVPVGSVAEETARLLDALLGAEPSSLAADPPLRAACPSCGALDTGHRTAPPPPPPQSPPSPPPSPSSSTCRLCPLCQLLEVARAVRPDTVDRLADLAAALTELLRDVAVGLRSEHPAGGSANGAGQRPTPGSTPGFAPPSYGADVEDIVVGTDDEIDEIDDLDRADVDGDDPSPREGRP